MSDERWQKRFERERKARKQAEILLEDKTRALFLSNQDLAHQYRNIARQKHELELIAQLLHLAKQPFDSSFALNFFAKAILDIWPYDQADIFWVDRTATGIQLTHHEHLAGQEQNILNQDEACECFVQLQAQTEKILKAQTLYWSFEKNSQDKTITFDCWIITRDDLPVALITLQRSNDESYDSIVENITMADRQLTALLEKRAQDKALKDKHEKLEETHKKLKNTQAQLNQSSKLASIGQLAAGVAHEINNPVAFISSNITTLGKYTQSFSKIIEQYSTLKKTASAHDDLQTCCADISALEKKLKLGFIQSDIQEVIQDSVDGLTRVKGIVDNLKTFSRVDAADKEKVDLNDCLISTIKIANHQLKDKCTIHTDFGDISELTCYPGQLNQVFLNMLINAGQAIETTGDIHVSTQILEDHIHVVFKDTGQGISPDHIEQLFDPFFTTKPVGEGTGLGLSVSYGIVENHQGQILVDSTPGQGTTFTIKLPLETAPSNPHH